MIQRLTRHSGTKFARPIALPVPVNVFGQPILQAPELALAEVVIEVGHVASGGGHELGGVQIAEGVRREVTEPAKTPVDVLQAAACIIRWRKPEKLPKFLAPSCRQIGRQEIAGHQPLLQLEPQNDVQVVGRFVGFDADERRLDIVDSEQPLIQRNVAEGRGQCLASAGKKMLPEWPRRADLVFPQS